MYEETKSDIGSIFGKYCFVSNISRHSNITILREIGGISYWEETKCKLYLVFKNYYKAKYTPLISLMQFIAESISLKWFWMALDQCIICKDDTINPFFLLNQHSSRIESIYWFGCLYKQAFSNYIYWFNTICMRQKVLDC